MSQQVYSVPTGDGRFRYYVGPDVGKHTPPPGPNPHLGTPAEEAGVKLPFGVRSVGEGDEVIGRVAEPGVNWMQVAKVGVYLLAAVGAWKLWKAWKAGGLSFRSLLD